MKGLHAKQNGFEEEEEEKVNEVRKDKEKLEKRRRNRRREIRRRGMGRRRMRRRKRERKESIKHLKLIFKLEREEEKQNKILFLYKIYKCRFFYV